MRHLAGETIANCLLLRDHVSIHLPDLRSDVFVDRIVTFGKLERITAKEIKIIFTGINNFEVVGLHFADDSVQSREKRRQSIDVAVPTNWLAQVTDIE